MTDHGFDLDPEDERLLRSPPPPAALAWCAEAAGVDARVVRAAPLEGGTSSAVHAVDVETAGGDLRQLVLRRFVRADWLAEEPDLPRREAAALRAVAGSAVPTPELVALDPTGERAGAPAVLMTRLDGAVVWRPAELDPFLERLAALLPPVHATPLPAAGVLPDYAPYRLQLSHAPEAVASPDVWARALALFHDPPPAQERCLVHRDYHPGNVLWRDGAVTGLVDWACTSIGSPDADVGHCRMNLAGSLGLAAADRFLAAHRTLTGRGPYDPYWDVAAALGGFEDADVATWTRLDAAFLAAAVARPRP